MIAVAIPARALHQPFGPAVGDNTPAFTYPGSFASLDSINFADFRFRVFSDHWVRLRNGSYDHAEEGIGESYALRRVWRFAAPQPTAVAELTVLSCGGSCSNSGLLYVLQLRPDKKLVCIQELTFDLQAEGTGAKFDTATRTLTIVARSNEDTPHCCPRHVDIVKFRWNGSRFSQSTVDHKPLPDDSTV